MEVNINEDKLQNKVNQKKFKDYKSTCSYHKYKLKANALAPILNILLILVVKEEGKMSNKILMPGACTFCVSLAKWSSHDPIKWAALLIIEQYKVRNGRLTQER